MPKFNHTDAALIEQLHHLVFHHPESKDILNAAFKEALAMFEQPDYAQPFASYNIPIEHFENNIADQQKGMVGLCRVFILRAGCKMPNPEIHRNSIQRLVSFTGKGAIHSASSGGVDMTFKACAISSPTPNAQMNIESAWDVVPENTWHFPVADDSEDWFTVTFHSASEADIIDEHSTLSTESFF